VALVTVNIEPGNDFRTDTLSAGPRRSINVRCSSVRHNCAVGRIVLVANRVHARRAACGNVMGVRGQAVNWVAGRIAEIANPDHLVRTSRLQIDDSLLQA
jgi:hypothetical protein